MPSHPDRVRRSYAQPFVEVAAQEPETIRELLAYWWREPIFRLFIYTTVVGVAMLFGALMLLLSVL
jgi:hypothetical protein